MVIVIYTTGVLIDARAFFLYHCGGGHLNVNFG